MAVTITAGTGTSIDTIAVSGNERQIMVIGDPITAANRAAVSNAAIADSVQAMGVRQAGVPAAAAGADAVANPTTIILSSFLSGFNGTTWDRLRTGIAGVGQALTGLLNTAPMMRDAASTFSNFTSSAFASLYSHLLAVGVFQDNGGSPTPFKSANAMGDAANGQNTPGFTPYVYNGSTYDRTTGTVSGMFLQGNVLHGGVDGGYPIKVGGYVITSLPTAEAHADRANMVVDKFGRQVVLPGTIRDLVGTQTTTISASTSETTIVTAGAAGIFNDVVLLVVSNTSATAVRVDFRDATGGSVLFSLYVPAGDARGFSLGGTPVPQTTAANNWTAQSSASVTDLRIYAVFHKNK